MNNENNKTAAAEETVKTPTTSEEFWEKQTREYWQAMSESGINKEIYDSFCRLLKPMPQVSWNCDTLFKAGAKTVKPVANFLPVPTEEILYDDGKEQQRYFRVTGRRSEDFRIIELPEITVKAADMMSMNWIIEKWGFGANIYPPYQSNKDTLRSIMVMIGEQCAAHKTVFTHTGWRKINDKWCFLHAGGAIGAENVEVRLEGNLSRYKFPENVLHACFHIVGHLQIGKVFRDILVCLLNLRVRDPLETVAEQLHIEHLIIERRTSAELQTIKNSLDHVRIIVGCIFFVCYYFVDTVELRSHIFYGFALFFRKFRRDSCTVKAAVHKRDIGICRA